MEYSVCHERAAMRKPESPKGKICFLVVSPSKMTKGKIGKKCAQDTMIQRMPNEGLLSEILTLSIRFHP